MWLQEDHLNAPNVHWKMKDHAVQVAGLFGEY